MPRQIERILRLTSGSPPVTRTLVTPSCAAMRTARSSSSSVSISAWLRLQTPSAGMQYWQRRLQSSVTETRR